MAKKAKGVKVTAMGIDVVVYPDRTNDYRLLMGLSSEDTNTRVRSYDKMLRLIFADKYDETLDKLQGDDVTLDPNKVAKFVDEVTAKVEALKN